MLSDKLYSGVMRQPGTGRRISVRVTRGLEERLRLAESAFDLAERAGLVGVVKGLPPDLSTNVKYMEGFGKKR